MQKERALSRPLIRATGGRGGRLRRAFKPPQLLHLFKNPLFVREQNAFQNHEKRHADHHGGDAREHDCQEKIAHAVLIKARVDELAPRNLFPCDEEKIDRQPAEQQLDKPPLERNSRFSWANTRQSGEICRFTNPTTVPPSFVRTEIFTHPLPQSLVAVTRCPCVNRRTSVHSFEESRAGAEL